MPAPLADVVATALSKQPYKRQADAREQLRKELVARDGRGRWRDDGGRDRGGGERALGRAAAAGAGRRRGGRADDRGARADDEGQALRAAGVAGGDRRQDARDGTGRTPPVVWVLAAVLSLGVIAWAIVLVVRGGQVPDAPHRPAVAPQVAGTSTRG